MPDEFEISALKMIDIASNLYNLDFDADYE
jgi:hypothetical protein